MRLLFYSVAGVVSALLGWSFAQIILIDISRQSELIRPDIILLPAVAACFALTVVITEIFLSNPTRIKASQRVLPPFAKLALATGLAAGMLAATLSWFLDISNAPDWLVRGAAWLVIGLFTGLGEGISWRFRSIEGATRKAQKRIWRSLILGAAAGLVAALFVEFLRRQISLGGYEEPIGFLILGLCLGASLSIATAPSYLVALRAGTGFEAVDPDYEPESYAPPHLNSDQLQFVTLDDDYITIEEGLSIQLPEAAQNQTTIKIGSSQDADIVIPGIPPQAAALTIKRGQVKLRCLSAKAVQVQRDILEHGSRPTVLRHNQILTFYHKGSYDKFYRFVFYNRFLDPEA